MYTEIFNVRDKKANLGFLINVFCIFLSVIFAAYYAFIRMDLGLDVEIFFKSVSFSIVMILLPLITSNVKHAIGNKTLLFQGFYTLSIIIILAIPGYFGVSIPSFILYGVAGIIIAVFLIKYSNLVFRINNIPYCLIFIVIAFGLVVFTYGGNFLSPLFVEKIIYKGELQPDTIFNISLANIFRNFHVISLGFNGVEFYRYHFGSHIIFGSLSKTLGVDVVAFYNLTYPLAIIPLFFRFFFNLILTVLKEIKIPAFLLILLFLLYFNRVFYSPEIGLYAFPFNSETYLTGLIFFFFGLQCLFLLVKRWDHLKKGYQNFNLFVLYPLTVLLISCTKISLGYFFYCIVGYLIIRHRVFREFRYLFALILSGLLFLLIFRFISYSGSEQLSLLHTVNTVIWLGNHLLTYFLLFWISFLLYLNKSKTTTIRGLFSWAWNEKFWPFDILVVTLILGIIPGLLLSMGNNWIYFTDVQSWLALIFIILLLPPLNLNRFWKKVGLYIVIIGLGARFVFFSADILKGNLRERNEIINLKLNDSANSYIDERNAYINKLIHLSETERTCTLIAPNDKIWSLFSKNTEFIPLLVPAFSGLPVFINDLPINIDSNSYFNHFLNPFLRKEKPVYSLDETVIIDSKPYRIRSID
jgi:hypothetical protein